MVLVVLVLALSVFAAGKTEAVTSDAKISGELVLANWMSGSEASAVNAVNKAFMAKYPDIQIKTVNTSAGAEDARAGIKIALLSGESFDLCVSTWPSFEQELIEAGLLQPIGKYWEQYNWDSKLNSSWRDLGSANDETWSVYFLAGNRSGLWYNNDVIAKAGITTEPKTLAEFTTVLDKLKANGSIPIALGAKTWAQGEWFANILLKLGGSEAARNLVERKIKWTDPVVVETFEVWASLLQKGYFGDAATMMSDEWNDAIDKVFSQKRAGYSLMGSWVNGMGQETYDLEPVTDYNTLQFPSIDPNHANAMSIDGKNFLMLKNGKNHDAAALYLDFVLSKEGSAIISEFGLLSPSSAVDLEQFDAISANSLKSFLTADVYFVLDDMLPIEMSFAFRSAVQKFISNPTQAAIGAITKELEAKASTIY